MTGSTLRAAREAANMTRLDLVRALDFEITERTLVRYEKGEQTPRLSLQRRLAEILNMKEAAR